MSLKKAYFLGAGPYYYDNALSQNPDPDPDTGAVNLDTQMAPDDPWSDDTPGSFAYNPADASVVRNFRVEEPIQQDADPVADTDTVIKRWVTSNTITVVGVANINAPDLSLYPTGATGVLLLAKSNVAGIDEYTLYAWDDTNSSGANSPYVVTGRIGYWVAIAGKYIYSV